MEGTIKIKQSLDAKKFGKALTYLLFTNSLAYVYGMIYISLLLNIILAQTLTIDPSYDNDPFINVFAALTILPFFFLLRRTYIAKTVLKKNGRFFENITYTFSVESLVKEGEGFTVTSKWSDLKKIKETKCWFLLYLNSQQAHIIDKSQLDPWQQDELKHIFQAVQSEVKVSLK